MENKTETPEKWYEKKIYIIALCCTGGTTIGLFTGYPFGVYQLWNSTKFTQLEKFGFTAGPLLIQLISIYNATK
jgi:hypothetical protein